MQFSHEDPPARPERTMAWAREELGSRIAVLASQPVGLIGYASGSLPDGLQETWEISVNYPELVVKTLRWPARTRPGVTVVDLLNEALTNFVGVPDDVMAGDLEGWLAFRAARPQAPADPVPEAVVIADAVHSGVQAVRDGVTARLVEFGGIAVIVVGAGLGMVGLTWV
ncbi:MULTISPECIES: hypothetical protein [Kitasatospora]|uniref:hypothetical protein n=1 Tax=Kitasatospora TaxID=2063 RepID=UPI000C7095E9|nr:hypothetical protein [Kitasatospora sp. GP30]MDH6139974.1 hypothetical protein [Kitasatospora sp. GP30]